jgi:ribonuclease HI
MIKIYCDGASKGNPGPASIGVWATDDSGNGNEGNPVFEISEELGKATNNIAEWSALLAGVRKAKDLGIKNVAFFLDSELVVKQVLKQYKIKKPEFRPFFEEIQNEIPRFESFQIRHIPREQNKKADLLANLALKKAE